MATTYLQKLRLINRDARLVLVATAAFGFTYFGVFAVLLNLYFLRLGYGPEFAGLVNGAGTLAYSMSALPAGLLGRRWGSRRLMILGMGLQALFLALVPVAGFLPSSSQGGWLLVTYALATLTATLFFVNTTPYLMTVTGPEERTHAFSVRGAMQAGAAAAGNALGGLLPGLMGTYLGVTLDDPAPYGYSLWTAAAVCLLAALSLTATREVAAAQPPQDGEEARIEGVRGRPPYMVMVVSGLALVLWAVGSAGTRSLFNVYLDAHLHAPTALIGVLVATGRLLACMAALAMPILVARWRTYGATLWGYLGVALSILALALIPHWASAGLGFMGVMVMIYIADPAFQIFSQELVLPQWRSTMNGAMHMAGGAGGAATLLVAGYVIAGMGYQIFFLIGAGLTAVGSLVFWAYFRVPRGQYTPCPVTESPSAT